MAQKVREDGGDDERGVRQSGQTGLKNGTPGTGDDLVDPSGTRRNSLKMEKNR